MKKEERLTLVKFIDSAVEQVTEVFQLNEEDSQKFRDAFSEIAVIDILSRFTNASDGNQKCYAFTSASNVMTPNIMQALSNANLPTLLPEGRCLLTKMIPVDDKTKSEAIALKEQLKKEGRFRLNLVEFIESAVEQVTEVFNLNEEDSQNFRNAFSEIAVEDILAGFVNASNGYQECYAFTSACSMMTTNITKALSKVNLSTVLPEGRCLLGTMIPADEVTRLEAIALKDQMATTKKSEEDKVKKYVK